MAKPKRTDANHGVVGNEVPEASLSGDIKLPSTESDSTPSEPTSGGSGDPAQPEALSTKNAALLACDAKNIQDCDTSVLIAIKSILQHGDMLDVWQTPRKWAPAARTLASLNTTIRERILPFLSKEALELYNEEVLAPLSQHAKLTDLGRRFISIIDQAVETANRYLLLVRVGPAHLHFRNHSSLDPTFVMRLAYSYVPPLVALAANKRIIMAAYEHRHEVKLPPELTCGDKYLSVITEGDLLLLTPSCRERVEYEIKRMQMFVNRGYWSDLPNIQRANATQDVRGPAPEPRKPKAHVPHLPLPDDYVSEMGVKGYWLINDLGPSLLAVATGLSRIWSETAAIGGTANEIVWMRIAEIKKLLENHVWRDSTGAVITAPPFNLSLSNHGRGRYKNRKKNKAKVSDALSPSLSAEESDKHPWPPRSLADIVSLLNRLQQAHMFVVLLATASRHGEITTMRRDCVHYAPNGMPLSQGRTFKLVESYEGKLRDWVLPDLATVAIEQQVRLVTLVEQIGKLEPEAVVNEAHGHKDENTHLWAEISGAAATRGKALNGISHGLNSYAKAIEMQASSGKQPLRPHRFRKTIARLAALALVQAPKILMDVFGHKSIEMTLYYILADQNLQTEIETVSRELRVIMAADAVENIVASEYSDTPSNAGRYGGPAALSITRAVEVYRTDLHKHGRAWGANSTYELAEILTLQGRAWGYIRRGVFCTKLPGTESGPCNKSRGTPEPSHCKSHCTHRLEEPFLADDVDDAIEDSVHYYQKASAEGNDLMKAMFAGQVRAHLGRFESVRQKWIDNEIVQEIIAEPEDCDA